MLICKIGRISLAFIFCFFFSIYLSADAQLQRTFIFRGDTVAFLSVNNRSHENFSYPGMRAYIIVGEKGEELFEIYRKDDLKSMPLSDVNDYTCFYYFRHIPYLVDSTFSAFFKSFISRQFEHDYIDRNHVYLLLNEPPVDISCNVIRESKTFLACVNVQPGHRLTNCAPWVNEYVASDQLMKKNREMVTSITYFVPGMIYMEEMEAMKAKRERHRQIKDRVSQLFVQFSWGYSNIFRRNKTEFDTRTLMDFSDYHSLWQLSAGYFITNRLAIIINSGLIFIPEKKNIDNVSTGNGQLTIQGSGTGGAIVRYGAGLGYIPYTRRKLSLVTECTVGGVYAIAGGGNGSMTIGGGSSNDIELQKVNSYFASVSAGIQYQLGKASYVTSGYRYLYSPIKEDIGSVKSFSGYSINVGLGFTMRTKKNRSHE